MSSSNLPERPSLEYLKKLAKERLRELRRADPGARLAQAQLAVARDHGFRSWRALKAEVDRLGASLIESFQAACAEGDVPALRRLLDEDESLVRERGADGRTCLHLAVRHPEAVRLLLERGADPNVREDGDNALPLHFAAAGGPIESVRMLLDAGSDVHGSGDDHLMDVIGWATVFSEPRREVAELLVERGARHHVFSAIGVGDADLLRRVIEDDPDAIRRRLSRHEQEQTALHYVVAPADGLVGGTFRTGEHYALLDALIEAGAELEARDAKGRTPLAVAMLKGDREAMRRLHAAGAMAPELPEEASTNSPAAFARSIGSISPMLAVADIEATVEWYRALGFELQGSHAEDGRMDWASVRFGSAEIMLVPTVESPRPQQESKLSLWMRTDRLEDLYRVLKRRQLERARAALADEASPEPEVRFTADLYTAFYGQREFGVRDPNGVELMFYQPLE
jgi:ankyrin repeat protein